MRVKNWKQEIGESVCDVGPQEDVVESYHPR